MTGVREHRTRAEGHGVGGSDEEQGLSVPHWTVEGSANGPLPRAPGARGPLGTSTLGRSGGDTAGLAVPG